MRWKSSTWFLLTLLIPVTGLGLATYLSYSPQGGATLSAMLGALAGGSAVTALAFALDAARIRRAFTHLRQGRGALGYEAPSRQRLRDERQHELLGRLRRQIEELSAIRDLALIANSDVRLERIMERSLSVLSGLLGAREIAIYIVERPDETLVPVAHLLGDTSRVRKGRPLAVEPLEARRALEDRRTIVESGRGGMRAATLLVADREVVGALEVRLPRSAPERDAHELAHVLEGLAKHLALAVRKPTLYDRAVVDALTGLYTKRHFMEQVQQHMAQRTRLGTPLSLVILDIDHFKQVNDVHGHVAGDLVLAEVANRVHDGIRAYDQAFRYGGEEMIVLAPNTPLEDAVRLAERLRAKLRGKEIEAGDKKIRITASFGVAEFLPGQMPDATKFVEAADVHLYRAKHNGRDQVQSPASPELCASS